MIKERPMLFSGPMVLGIIDESKTQTRRAIKNQPVIDPQTGDWLWTHSDGKEQVFPMERYTTSRVINCKYGKIGDRIWVKETFGQLQEEDGGGYVYRADMEPNKDSFIWQPWKPSIFMPRVASRILLEITDVRVERLQDISEADAIAEGVAHLFTAKEIEQNPRLAVSANSWYNYLWHGDSEAPTKYVNQWDYQYSGYKTAAGSYSSLWAKINGPESWHQNPFVWAITFKRLE